MQMEQKSASDNRLVSIDALRGFAMFLILAIDIGGAPILQTFTKLWGEPFASAASKQFSYGFVEGLRLCFIAMPMFLFVVGLTMPLSLRNRRMVTDMKTIHLHIIKRSVILFLLGLIAGGHLLSLKFDHMPLYNNVLEYISIGYLVCAMLVLHTSMRTQCILAGALLVGYWALFMFVPVPGWQGERYSSQMNLGIYIDNMVLGPFHKPGSWQVLATISFIANMLLGVLVGHIVTGQRKKEDKVKVLLLWGLVMVLAGVVWSFGFPIIRSLWTSSFVLVTCGLTTLLLAAFFQIIDVMGRGRWAFFFVVFGANSIAVYMMAHLFDFRLIGNVFVGGVCSLCLPNVQAFIQAVAAMAVMWLIMYFLYRKKTFIKI